jgi:uncharacterized membrane protein
MEDVEFAPVESGPPDDVNENDRLMAALSYPIPIVGIIILLAEDMKVRPFQKYHAVQSLAANVALWVIITVLGCVLAAVTFFIGGVCGLVPLVLWFATLYWAYLAYQGQTFEIPYITEFCRKQGWF